MLSALEETGSSGGGAQVQISETPSVSNRGSYRLHHSLSLSTTLAHYQCTAAGDIMGSCCSNGRDIQLPNSPSFTRITDSILQMRQPTVELQEEDVEELIQVKLEEAYQWYLASVKSLLDWKQPALDTKDIDEALDKLVADTKNYFRTLFVQGTTGENVPFAKIEKSEIILHQFCKSDLALFRYCNIYKSFAICSSLKRELIKDSSQGKIKLLKQYDKEAQGPYATRCRNDLDELLTLLSQGKSQQDVEIKLDAQLAMDQDILSTKRTKAQDKARTQLEDVFQGSPERHIVETSSSKSLLHSQASVLDLINRIGSAPESSSQSMVMSGTVGSLKENLGLKKHSTEEPPKREDSISGGSSNPSNSSSPLPEENPLRSRVLCMDRSALHKLE